MGKTMYQNTATVRKSSHQKAETARIGKLMAALEKANQDPEFRKAAKEFVKMHTR